MTMRGTVALFVVILSMQIAFWYKTREILPDMSIVPDVPGQETVQALSLGDEQFFFRLLGLQIQNAGDTFGRFTALYKYDYNKLYHWFRLLDTLDNKSNYIPAMATYYFSQTQHTEDVKYIVDYLVEYVSDRVEMKWWWLVQAIYLANHKLEDKDLALKIANSLSADKNIPVWVKQMPAFIYEQKGEFDSALKIIDQVVAHSDSLKQGDINFINTFVKERLGKLEEAEKTMKIMMEKKQPDQPQSETDKIGGGE